MADRVPPTDPTHRRTPDSVSPAGSPGPGPARRRRGAWRTVAMTVGALLVLGGLGGIGALSQAQNGAAPRKAASLEKVFPSSSKCKRCHYRSFEEWEASPLAKSIHSTAFRVSLEQYLAFSKNEDQARCFRCHAPHINEFEEQAAHFVKQVRSGDPYIDGVGCTQCHLIKEVDFTQHPPLPKYEPGRTLYGPYGDSVKNLAHESMELEIYRKSALCLNCHQGVPTAKPLGRANDLLGAWETSAAVKGGKECQTCHMPEQIGESANGEPKRRVANHTFPGRVGRLRQEAAKLTLASDVSGAEAVVRVTVQSLVPHNLPTTHPAWARVQLHLRIRGKNLRTVYEETREFGRTYADAQGKPTVFDFAAVKVVRDTVLKPEERRVEEFRFPRPADAPSMDVIATLRYAPVTGPKAFLERIEAESPRGRQDPAFQPIMIVEKSVNVPLRKKK